LLSANKYRYAGYYIAAICVMYTTYRVSREDLPVAISNFLFISKKIKIAIL